MSPKTSLCVHLTVAGLMICLLPVVANGQDAPGRIEMPGTRVSLILPAGFTLNEQIQGFADPNGATIVVLGLDQPFAEMSADMTQAKRADMTILAARPTKLENGRLATWAHIRQTYGGETFFKWLLIFGDAKTMTTVTVTVPERHAVAYEAALAQSLGTVRWSPAPVTTAGPSAPTASPRPPASPSAIQSPPSIPSRAIDTSGLPFTIEPASGFENVLRIGATALGIGLIGTAIPNRSGSPLLVVESAEPVAPVDLSARTMSLFMQTTPLSLSQRILHSSDPTTIGGKPAHEVVGRASHTNGYQAAIYAVIIAGAPSLRIFASCRLEDQAKYFASFRQMVQGVVTPPAPQPLLKR